MIQNYDVIVVGAGSMGMSAGYELAARGLKTLLVDAFDPPHTMGSHHGDTRLIRHVYYGGDHYVKLALRADERWLELERLSGEKLLERSGVVSAADPDVYDYGSRLAVAAKRGVPFEEADAAEIGRRWPGIALPGHFKGFYEPTAGFLYSEKCIAAYKAAALAAGAALLTGTTVTGLEPDEGAGGGVTVRTDRGTFRAGKALISAGAWFKRLAPTIALPVRGVRKAIAWFETTGSAYDLGSFPGFLVTTRQGEYYGFPSADGKGLKIGRHDGGGTEWQPGSELASFGCYPGDEGDLRGFLERYMPGAAGRLLHGAVCRYEMSPDEDFIIDFHPVYRNVLLAGGFSGHGFKFASAVGEAAADLLERGSSEQDLRPFSLARFERLERA